jgi:hypothetical protein
VSFPKRLRKAVGTVHSDYGIKVYCDKFNDFSRISALFQLLNSALFYICVKVLDEAALPKAKVVFAFTEEKVCCPMHLFPICNYSAFLFARIRTGVLAVALGIDHAATTCLDVVTSSIIIIIIIIIIINVIFTSNACTRMRSLPVLRVAGLSLSVTT